MPRVLLVLDDDRTRLRGFEEIASRLGDDWIVKGWRDAPTMLAEIDRYLDGAGLISLDHDLYKDLPADPDPGSGRLIADYRQAQAGLSGDRAHDEHRRRVGNAQRIARRRLDGGAGAPPEPAEMDRGAVASGRYTPRRRPL
jgi:hypothetical protein